MPSNSPINKTGIVAKPGTLYVVATPIGHRDDITVRALNILSQVDQIAAEDTRKTRRFLERHGIKASLISYHEHNERERTPQIIDKLHNGRSIALVSNAGTPTVSDPGYRLITSAIQNSVNIVPVPGVSATTAALSVAGLSTDAFTFAGFLPKKKGKRLRLLAQLAQEPRTVILYESPKRILTLLDDIADTMGDRHGVMAREMTKRHEEFLRGRLSEIRMRLEARPEVKGEITLLVAGSEGNSAVEWNEVLAAIRHALETPKASVSKIARNISQKYGVSKNRVYQEALKVTGQKTEDPSAPEGFAASGRGQKTETKSQ
jgi:16S rRNA (cytidine1402-2'-O)-methyltransferase